MIRGKNELSKYYIQRFNRLKNRYYKFISKLNRNPIRTYILQNYENNLSDLDESLNNIDSQITQLEFIIKQYFIKLKKEKKIKKISPFIIYYMKILIESKSESEIECENFLFDNPIYNHFNTPEILEYEKNNNMKYINSVVINKLINDTKKNINNNFEDINDID